MRLLRRMLQKQGDILLNGYDIMRLQEYLDISLQELLFTYCELYIGNTSGLPVVRLRTEARCPFLLHKKCYVQDAKPAVCALFPLGRIYDGEQIRYFLQESRCGTGMEEHTLQEWLEPLGSESEKCCILWSSLLKEGVMAMKQIKEENGDIVEAIQDLMVTLMYDSYDSKEDPARQIQERIDIARELPKKVSELSAMGKAKIATAIKERA